MRLQDAEGQPLTTGLLPSKAEFRARVRAARAGRAPNPSAEVARAVRALAACSGVEVVAAYVSRVEEPSTAQVLDALLSAEVAVLLPVLGRRPDWAWYEGPDHLMPGPLGIPQPDGRPLGADALGRAGFVWLPGLAGTPDGRRLGTGGGWYDRALAWADPAATKGLLLFDDEVFDDVPTDRWDRSVDLLVTECRRIDCRNSPEPIPG